MFADAIHWSKVFVHEWFFRGWCVFVFVWVIFLYLKLYNINFVFKTFRFYSFITKVEGYKLRKKIDGFLRESIALLLLE